MCVCVFVDIIDCCGELAFELTEVTFFVMVVVDGDRDDVNCVIDVIDRVYHLLSTRYQVPGTRYFSTSTWCQYCRTYRRVVVARGS